ncbi:translation initiation factor IF-2 [Cervus elaphus]|uniref:translation initiation factor IF-2 n=1 Tax=Cervus elaphus TaxID=9860 RepID=UPI001CC2D9FA|nr:translation initiation factor IF-2 [Cervus elaphus]
MRRAIPRAETAHLREGCAPASPAHQPSAPGRERALGQVPGAHHAPLRSLPALRRPPRARVGGPHRSPPQGCLIRVGAGSAPAPAPAPRASHTRTFRRRWRRRWAAAEGEGGGGGRSGSQVERRPRVPACRSGPLPAPPPSRSGRGERLGRPGAPARQTPPCAPVPAPASRTPVLQNSPRGRRPADLLTQSSLGRPPPGEPRPADCSSQPGKERWTDSFMSRYSSTVGNTSISPSS